MDTRKLYDSNASRWARLQPSSLSDFTARPLVFDACGDVTGKTVLDIGCGEGYCLRELKRRGAGDCLGIDLSQQMIDAAVAQDAADGYGIDYRAGDVTGFIPDRHFDLCIAVFLFNYMRSADMARVCSMVRRALTAGGRFVFSVPHPFFPFLGRGEQPPFYFSAPGKNYFTSVDEQFEGEIFRRDGGALPVQCVHKTFTAYFDALRNAGFTSMPEVTELTVTEELAATDEAFFGPLLNQPLHVLFNVSA